MSDTELQEEEREVLSSIYDGDDCFKQISPNTFQYKVSGVKFGKWCHSGHFSVRRERHGQVVPARNTMGRDLPQRTSRSQHGHILQQTRVSRPFCVVPPSDCRLQSQAAQRQNRVFSIRRS
jgi:hypothetical protein